MSLEGSPTTHVPIPRARTAKVNGEYFIVLTIKLFERDLVKLLYDASIVNCDELTGKEAFLLLVASYKRGFCEQHFPTIISDL
jgi:hypothetical protein